MSWILIVLVVLLAAFGPMLWLKPSAKDKRLTALRQRARACGLNVDVRPLERLNPTAQERVSAAGKRRDTTELLAVYETFLPKRLRRLSGFRLLRGPADDEPSLTRAAVEVRPGWHFDPADPFPPEQGWPRSLEALAALFEALPADVRAVFVTARSVGVYWAEGPAAQVANVESLAAALTLAATDLAGLDALLASDEPDRDS